MKQDITYPTCCRKMPINTKNGSYTADEHKPELQHITPHNVQTVTTNLFATCNGSAASQNVLQLVEILNESKSLLHKMLCMNVPH